MAKRKSNKSISKRIKLKKSGKILRRSMGLGHSRANKNSVQANRRKHERNFEVKSKILRQFIH